LNKSVDSYKVPPEITDNIGNKGTVEMPDTEKIKKYQKRG
jgi:hypothetical protein